MISIQSTDNQGSSPQTLLRLWDQRDFPDVTLVSGDGHQLEAHRGVLAASSPFFRDILMKSPHSKPLLYLGNVDQVRLASILQFMYLGQVELKDSELESFLSFGKDFLLSGLSEEGLNIKMPYFEGENTASVQPPLDHFIETVDVKSEPVSSFILDCPLCHRSFNEMSDLNSHIADCSSETAEEQNLKPEDKLACDKCDFVPEANKGAKLSLERHKFKVHGANICNTCGFEAKTLTEMNQHNISAHTKDSVKCDQCKKHFASASQLKSHTKVVHSPDIVPCPRCKVKFGNSQKLEVHLPVCTVFPCDLCEYGAMSASSLEQHKRFKHEGIRYNCEMCTYVTGFEGQLELHIQEKHKNKRQGAFPCDQCKMRCMTAAGLELHKQRIHTDERVIPIGGVLDSQGVIRFQCDVCDYKATTNGNLMMHKKNKHIRA